MKYNNKNNYQEYLTDKIKNEKNNNILIYIQIQINI